MNKVDKLNSRIDTIDSDIVFGGIETDFIIDQSPSNMPIDMSLIFNILSLKILVDCAVLILVCTFMLRKLDDCRVQCH